MNIPIPYPWADGTQCAITVCDKDCRIIYMNARARATFAKHGDLIGKNLMDCHPPRAQQLIRHLLETGDTNAYTITKGGLKKMIYQTPWRDADGAIAGLAEISMVIPDTMPHYNRD